MLSGASLLFLSVALFPVSTMESKPDIRLQQPKGSKPHFEVVGLEEKTLRGLARAGWKAAEWNACFAVFVTKGDPKDRLPMLGDYSVQDGTVRFVPRFGLSPGLKYAAELDLTKLPDFEGPIRDVIRREFDLPCEIQKPTTVVTNVFPSSDVLPENLLRFYVHFSAPMSKGEACDRIKLVDENGREIERPFLEIGEELWDRELQRFTLILDPGRIKRGLKPREELGPIFEAGKSYSLVIDGRWNDATGTPLKSSYTKKFRVAAPVDKPIDVKTWRITPPAAGSTGDLLVAFPAPLDHALVTRLLHVIDDQGRRVAGSASILKNETAWRFEPAAGWTAGNYQLVVPTFLEDLAGNQVGRAFEVDEFQPKQVDPRKDVVTIPFTVSPDQR